MFASAPIYGVSCGTCNITLLDPHTASIIYVGETAKKGDSVRLFIGRFLLSVMRLIGDSVAPTLHTIVD